MLRLLAGLSALASALVLAAPAQAAAPRYILVTGPGLELPTLLSNWAENGRLLLAAANGRRVGAAEARNRSRYGLAFFWGWKSKRVPTRPEQANQHGWFYPAHGSRRALVYLKVDGVLAYRVATPALLAILRRHGVPALR